MSTFKNMTPWRSTSTPTRWANDPFRLVQDEMDKMLSAFGGRDLVGANMLKGSGWDWQGTLPSIDICENEKSFTLTAELAGMDEKDIELSIHDGLLTLKGEKKIEDTRKEGNFHVQERAYGSFNRTIQLPDGCDDAKADATFKKGVLTVTMPKTAKSQTKKTIAIKAS